MKKITFLLTVLVIITGEITAQNHIAVSHNGVINLYTLLDSAVINAQSGDTLYLTGGTFKLTQTIDKPLYIVGVGHNPDFANTVGITLVNQILLDAGASDGSITGILLINDFIIINSILNYGVTRCNLNEVSIRASCSNLIFSENIFRSTFNGSNSAYCFFNNNIFAGSDYGSQMTNCTYKNNIFLHQNLSEDRFAPVSSQYSIFENNIIIGSKPNIMEHAKYSIFRNNLFCVNFVPDNSTYFGSNNIVNQNMESIFINQTGYSFNYTYDYHLQATSPGKNDGTDGTDIGIYGGAYPWKEGSIPFNPHFQQIKIAPNTDANGNLNVNIVVKAQEN